MPKRNRKAGSGVRPGPSARTVSLPQEVPAHTAGTGRYRWNPTVPHRIAINPNISPNAKAVLLVLLHHAGPGDQCWPSDERMAGCTGLSVPTIQRTLRELERLEVISRITDRNGRLIRMLSGEQTTDHRRIEDDGSGLTNDQVNDQPRSAAMITGDQRINHTEENHKNHQSKGDWGPSSTDSESHDEDACVFAEIDPTPATPKQLMAIQTLKSLLGYQEITYEFVDRFDVYGLHLHETSRSFASKVIEKLRAALASGRGRHQEAESRPYSQGRPNQK